MPRNLTPAEKAKALNDWPNMNVNSILVTAEPTEQYNCLAWTLGITNNWVWPWGSGLATKAQFDVLYKSYGYDPVSGGNIAAWGKNLSSMTHGSIFSYPYNKWESKCGASFRIIHTLPEMEGGPIYGDVQYYFAKRTALQLKTKSVEENFNKENTLSKEEEKVLGKLISNINIALVNEFNKKYEKWKNTWSHPLIIISSNPADRGNSIEFLELISMGKDIIPLLIDKLRSREEFFALVALERIIDQRLIINKDLDDETILMGEQGRALETIKRWIQYNL